MAQGRLVDVEDQGAVEYPARLGMPGADRHDGAMQRIDPPALLAYLELHFAGDGQHELGEGMAIGVVLGGVGADGDVEERCSWSSHNGVRRFGEWESLARTAPALRIPLLRRSLGIVEMCEISRP